MIKIAPSILAGDFLNLNLEIKRLEEAQADYIHFDIMDGHFVPNITFGFKFIESIKKNTQIPFDVHLMISQPEKYIKQFSEVGSNIITFHYETTHFPIRLITEIKKHKCLAGISINPATPIESIYDILPHIDLVLLMSVEPGFYGQNFIEGSFTRIAQLKERIVKMKLKTLIEVDGGVSLNNYKALIDAQVDILVIGSDFFKQKDYLSYVKQIKSYETK